MVTRELVKAISLLSKIGKMDRSLVYALLALYVRLNHHSRDIPGRYE